MPIQQVTLSWLKQPGNAAHEAALARAAESLRAIPGVLDLRIGRCARLGRPSQDESFDFAMVVTFADEQAVAGWGPHPLHQAAGAVMREHVARAASYSFHY